MPILPSNANTRATEVQTELEELLGSDHGQSANVQAMLETFNGGDSTGGPGFTPDIETVQSAFMENLGGIALGDPFIA